MEPPPDTKDWTWVLTERCPDCGLLAGEVDPAAVADRAIVAAEEWVVILRSSPAVVERPAPMVWSPLQYGCHVRDVYVLFDARLERMLGEDDPVFANWDQDETARTSRYSESDPEKVAEDLEAAAQAFAARLRAVTGDQWQRPGRRSDGARFTVASFAQYFLHDVVHHLWDVTGQSDAATSLLLEPEV